MELYKDTTKLDFQQNKDREKLANTLFDCVREAHYEGIIDLLMPNLLFSYKKDSLVLRNATLTNRKATEVLQSISQILNYEFFKIMSGFKLVSNDDVVVAKLYKKDTDKEPTACFFFILDSHSGLVKTIVLEWYTLK